MQYQDIITEAKLQANRDDEDINNSIDRLLRMVEADINRLLRTSENSKIATLVAVADQHAYPLPSDFNGMRTIQVDNIVYEFDIPERAVGSTMNLYCLLADQLYLSAVQGGAEVKMIYYQTVLPLSDKDPQNWVSRVHPDVYIDGLVYQIEKYVNNEQQAQYRHGLFMDHINKIEWGDQVTRWSGTPLTIKSAL